MLYKYLGKTGISVSEICLGTLSMGTQLEERESIRCSHMAFDSGVNFIDTANFYSDGNSEICVGKSIKGRRDKIIVASKVGMKIDGLDQCGLSRHHIINQVELSLKRLDTEYIDIYYMHTPDPHTSVEETLRAFETLIQTGKIRYIGVSNYAAWQIAEMLWVSEKQSLSGPVVAEMPYNLLTRNIENEYFPFAEQFNLATVVYNPLAGGLLTGKHLNGAPKSGSRFTQKIGNADMGKIYMDRYFNADNLSFVERFNAIAQTAEVGLAELSLRWCISGPHIQSVIIGFSRAEQLQDNLNCLRRGTLSDDVMLQCGQVWADYERPKFHYNR